MAAIDASHPAILLPMPKADPSGWSRSAWTGLARRLGEIARRSACLDKAVACVYTRSPGEEIAWGMNGCYWEGDACGSRVPGYNHCVHAEQRCSAAARDAGRPTAGASAWISFAPCLKCAALLLEDQVGTVVFLQPHRDPRGLLHLVEAGVEVSWYDGTRLVPMLPRVVLEAYLNAPSPDMEAATLRSAPVSDAQRAFLALQRYLVIHARNKEALEWELKRLIGGEPRQESAAPTTPRAPAPVLDPTGRPSMLRLKALIEMEEFCLAQAERGSILERHP